MIRSNSTSTSPAVRWGFFRGRQPVVAARYNAAVTAPDNPPKSRRRWLRFSLRTLLVVMLLFGVGFGVLGMMANEARRQRKVVADLIEMGAYVEFSDEHVWLPELMDTGYCRRVKRIHAIGAHFNDASPLAEFKNLESLTLAGSQVSDVSSLAGLKKLEVLILSQTQVADVTPLLEMNNLKMKRKLKHLI